MTSQTSSSHIGEPRGFCHAGRREKMPEPAMMPLMTAEVVEAKPNSRRKPERTQEIVEVAVAIGQNVNLYKRQGTSEIGGLRRFSGGLRKHNNTENR